MKIKYIFTICLNTFSPLKSNYHALTLTLITTYNKRKNCWLILINHNYCAVVSLKSFSKKSISFMIERLPMPRIALRSPSQDLLIFVFSFFCSFAVRLPFWRTILAYRLRARLSSAAAATPQLQAPSRRFFAERATTWTAEIVVLDQHDDQLDRVGWRTTSRTRQDDGSHAMPAGIGASYRSLGDLGEDVYKSTTIVDQTQTTGQSVFESVKKAFSFASPKVEIRKKDPLIEDRRESISIVSR